jgi:hypothetical protein
MKTIPKYFCVCSALLTTLSLPGFHASADGFGLTNFADAFVTTRPSGNLSVSKSRSFGTTSFRPLLTLTVPEPGSFSLSLTALVLVAGRRLLTWKGKP